MTQLLTFLNEKLSTISWKKSYFLLLLQRKKRPWSVFQYEGTKESCFWWMSIISDCGWRLLCFHNLFIAGVLLLLSPLSRGLVSDIRVLRGFQKPDKLILVQHHHYDTPFWNRPEKCIYFKNVGNDLFHSHYLSAGNQSQCHHIRESSNFAIQSTMSSIDFMLYN